MLDCISLLKLCWYYSWNLLDIIIMLRRFAQIIEKLDRIWNTALMAANCKLFGKQYFLAFNRNLAFQSWNIYLWWILTLRQTEMSCCCLQTGRISPVLQHGRDSLVYSVNPNWMFSLIKVDLCKWKTLAVYCSSSASLSPCAISRPLTGLFSETSPETRKQT